MYACICESESDGICIYTHIDVYKYRYTYI